MIPPPILIPEFRIALFAVLKYLNILNRAEVRNGPRIAAKRLQLFANAGAFSRGLGQGANGRCPEGCVHEHGLFVFAVHVLTSVKYQ